MHVVWVLQELHDHTSTLGLVVTADLSEQGACPLLQMHVFEVWASVVRLSPAEEFLPQRVGVCVSQ